MADLAKLEAPKDWTFGPNEIESLRQAVLHLEPIIGPWLDEYDAMALYEILDVYCIRFDDGYGIGVSADDDVCAAYVEGNRAMLVASTFIKDPAVSYFEMKYYGPMDPPMEREEIWKRKDALMARRTDNPADGAVCD